MVEKTELMKQFEGENPGKHAVWAGKVTKQFKEWKESRSDLKIPIIKEKIE